jgi:tetratricopeptide (TPR) repeat protein
VAAAAASASTDGPPATAAATTIPATASTADQSSPESTAPLELPPDEELRTVEELEALLATDPANGRLRGELLAAYLRAGQIDDARRLIRETIPAPVSPRPFTLSAEGLIRGSRFDMARLVVEVGLEHFPDDVYLEHLGLMAMILGGAEPAVVEAASAALNLNPPGDANGQIAAAYLAGQNGDAEAALGVLEAAREAAGDNNPFLASVLYLTGRVHQAQGARVRAAQAFNQAMRAQPPFWLLPHLREEIQ